MKRFTRAALDFVASLFVVSLLIFLIVSLTPGDIAQIHNLSDATAAQFHLDKPLVQRFFHWIADALTLDLGVSVVNGEPVSKLLWQYAPTTIWLALGSIALSLAISLPVGILLGLFPDSRWGKGLGLLTYSISSVPVFVLGYIVLAIIFGVFHFYSPQRPEGPFEFWPWFSYYVVPVIVLAVGNGTVGEFVRFISLETQQINSSMYLRAARARGASLVRHFFRSMLLPMFNIIVTNIAVLLGGVVVVERIFNFHGLGWLGWEATLNRNFPVIMAITLLMAFVVRFFMLGNQLLTGWLDPRARA